MEHRSRVGRRTRQHRPPADRQGRILPRAAGGLAAVSLLDQVALGETLGILLLALSFLTAASDYRRWALNERAMRLNEPMPKSRLPMMMAIGTAVVAVVAAVVPALQAARVAEARRQAWRGEPGMREESVEVQPVSSSHTTIRNSRPQRFTSPPFDH